MKVFDTYPGGKGGDGVFQTIIRHIPPHDVFISGFLGNCAVMRHKLPAKVNIGIDVDTQVINAWKAREISQLAQADSVFCPEVQLDLFQTSFFDYFEQYFKSWNYPDVFVFLDPPYLKESRRDKTTDLYNHELTERDHRHLLSICLSMRSMVMISCYDNPLYADYLDKWHKVNFTGRTRHGSVTETIYMNYPLTGQLHDYRYTGKDYIDRQRIQRKVTRHIDKLNRLPVAERNAILNALAENFAK
jgi:DNA adenine methylase